MYQFIDDELSCHLADCVDDLVAQGASVEQAQVEAKQKFGDELAIRTELKRLHPPLLKIALCILTGCALLTGLALFGLVYFKSDSLLGITSQQLLLRWCFFAVIALMVLLDYWVLQFFGIKQRQATVLSLLLTELVVLVITVVLDINNFEVAIHNAIFGLIMLGAMWLLWQHLAWLMRRLTIYGTSVVMIVSAELQRPLFNWVLPHPCLYVIKDDSIPLTGALTHCQQVQWYQPILWLLYIIAAVSIVSLIGWVIQLWRNHGTQLSRKLAVSISLALLSLAPVMTHGINNHGALDIIPWERDIYTAYIEILGRAPQDKDIQFYATTKAYKHLSKVKTVLYNSPERYQKVKQVLQEISGKTPSQKQINYYAHSFMSIEQIRQDYLAKTKS